MGATQNLIFRSFFSPPDAPVAADAEDFTGTRVIPQMGQAPGSSVTMNGCMEQVYCFFTSAVA